MAEDTAIVTIQLKRSSWLRGTVVGLERRSLTGELAFPANFRCPALDLRLTGDHLCG